MDAIVTAGGVPKPGDTLYAYTQGKAKAMLDIAGKPMAQWVLDAINESALVERVVVVGLGPDAGLEITKPVVFIPNQGSMLKNIQVAASKVVEVNPEADLILVVSSDIPAITSEMVDWAIRAARESDDDIYYNVVPREVMESRFPGSNRSFIRFKDVEVCGGDMNIIRASITEGRDEIWGKLVAARKNALKQASLLGFDTLFLLLLRRLTIDAAVKKAGKRLGLRGRAVISPYAEIGMDVDKPGQLELLRADLAKRAA